MLRLVGLGSLDLSRAAVSLCSAVCGTFPLSVEGLGSRDLPRGAVTLYRVLNVIGGPFSSFLAALLFMLLDNRDLVSLVRSLVEPKTDRETVRFGGDGSFFSLSSLILVALPIVVYDLVYAFTFSFSSSFVFSRPRLESVLV